MEIPGGRSSLIQGPGESLFCSICIRKSELPGWVSGKKSTCQAGDVSLIPSLGRSPGEGNATHSSHFAWEMLWMGEPGGLQSMGSQKSLIQLSD